MNRKSNCWQAVYSLCVKVMVLQKNKNGIKEETTMQKIMIDIKSMAALLMAGAAFAACSNDADIISQQPARPEGSAAVEAYTMTVSATKGVDATTRALTLTDKTLSATWATTENVYVQKGETWATGSLQPDADASTANLKGSLSGVTISAGDALTLQFPRSGKPDYTGQVGTLADIAAKYDYATATVTVDKVDDTGDITVDGPVTFTNQQSVVKFTLKDKDGGALLNASNISVKVTAGVMEITNSEFTIPAATYTTNGNGVVYIAVQNIPEAYSSLKSDMTLVFTASLSNSGGDYTYTYTKNGWPFADGKYHEVTVNMTRQTTTDLSTLTRSYTAPDGQTLTGAISGDYLVSIANGASVTLSGATIDRESDNKWPGIRCNGNATITLVGQNVVKARHDDCPGIQVGGPSTTLTIQGEGKLSAEGLESCAGIGTTEAANKVGDIKILGGTITATGGYYGAGIGGSWFSTFGNITISGGVVTANGGEKGAGIGGGNKGSCGNILIDGGTVTAKGGDWAAGIGCGCADDGDRSSCGDITITDGVTHVKATKGINDWNTNYEHPESIGKGGRKYDYGTTNPRGQSECGTVTIDDPSKVEQR